MNQILLSEKQTSCLKLLKGNGLKRINILEGAVRSGKTYVSLIMFAALVASKPRSAVFLMAGKTLTSLKRNCLELLIELCGASNFNYSASKKEAELFGRKIFLEGVSDSRAENKIRGLSLDGAYCDELSLLTEDFFAMLLSRLSKPDAKLIASTNPDAPSHWLKKNVIDSESFENSLLDVSFSLEDNPFLPADYVDSIKTEYSGVFFERFVLGRWVAAVGRIYSGFSASSIVPPEFIAAEKFALIVVGVDFGGNKSASSFSLVGFSLGFKAVYLIDEFFDPRNLSAENLIAAFKDKIFEWKELYPSLSVVYCDSAEQLLVKSFRSAVPVEVKNALKKPVNFRISMLNRLISSGRFFVSKSCPRFIDAVQNALWDEKKQTDTRLDDGSTNIDSLDSFEYAVERFSRQLFSN